MKFLTKNYITFWKSSSIEFTKHEKYFKKNQGRIKFIYDGWHQPKLGLKPYQFVYLF